MLKKGMLPLVVVAEAGAVDGAGPVSSVFDPWPKSGMPQEISQRVAEWIAFERAGFGRVRRSR
jgi:hypothetical protein